MPSVLTITGSDNTGWSGLQLDHRTITEMGGHALTATTSIVMQRGGRVCDICDIAADVIGLQIRCVVDEHHPRAVKVGLLRSAEAVQVVRHEVIGCRCLVMAPGFMSSGGVQLVDDAVVEAFCRYLLPCAHLLIVRCNEAEKLLGCRIGSDRDMLDAARQLTAAGAGHVLLRGGRHTHERLTALLYTPASATGDECYEYYSSLNVDGWQRHGVGGALSAAITTCLAMGEPVLTAVHHAHEYVHSHIVYSLSDDGRRARPADIYNRYMTLVATHSMHEHNVAYYAAQLHITTRYLSTVTDLAVGKSPKQIIADYLLVEAKRQLANTRASVKEVSHHLGFSTVALFCRFFRQQAQMSPNEYRISVESLS